MEIGVKLTKPLQEVKYLATENTWRYRPIMRFFYYQYEQLRYWLYKEEVFAELKKHPEFAAYTIEECQQDLDTLVQWKNLIPVQDTAKARTVEEFKTKQFRYQLSEYAVEIERMTITLENLSVEGASLEPGYIERIREAIGRLPSMADAEPKTAGSWWHGLNADFKSLNQNYQDYIRSFHSMQAEELMKSTAFIAYKGSVIEYLRDFIKVLQTHSYWIEEQLRSFDERMVEKVLSNVFAYEKSIPRLESVGEWEIMENIRGRWQSLRLWFLGSEERSSEVVKLFEITNELIRKITRYAARIVEDLNSAANRKEEYKKLAELFLACDGIGECNKLSALAFGVFNSRHFKGDQERTTESINSSVYAEPPLMVEIRPRTRRYKEKAAKRPIVDKSAEKGRLYREYIERINQEQAIIQSYIKDDQINFAALAAGPELPAYVRLTLLHWVSRASATENRRGKTENGRVFRLLDPPNGARCVLRCTDGMLEMPAYIICFEEGKRPRGLRPAPGAPYGTENDIEGGEQRRVLS
ncbi:MAG TPA: TIGR02677 family protein [Hydrogenispora sp.]|nr:TIGR02677 family protein [Hydrogenispora sp.]